MFSEGREDVNDEEWARCQSTSTTDKNIDEVNKIVLTNRRITVTEVAEDLNISMIVVDMLGRSVRSLSIISSRPSENILCHR